MWIADDPTAFAERGARALVPEASALVVIDLGQSRLKLYAGGQCFAHERPWDRLPLHGGDIPIAPVMARNALREWLGTALSEAVTRTGTDPESIRIRSIEPMVWPDASLGCAPGIERADEPRVPGYVVTVDAPGTTLRYHTDDGDRIVVCNGE